MDKSINEILNKIGLTDKETTVYKTLLEYGISNAAKISMAVSIPRQTVYSLLDGLVEQGLVEQSDKAGVKQFFADPSHLLSFLEKKKKSFDSLSKDFEKELPNLLAKQQKYRSLPKVLYYEGSDGLKRLLENILDQYKKGDEKIFRGYGINYFNRTTIKDFLQSFVKERSKFGVETRLLIGKGDDDFGITNEKNKLGREVKHLDIEPQQAGIYIAGNRAYLFSYEDNVGVMIENEAITKMFKATFDAQWKNI